MPTVCSIRLDASGYQTGLKQVESSTRASLSEVKKSADALPQNVDALNQMSHAVGAIGAAAGVSIPPVAGLASALKVLKSAAGLVGAALAVVAVVAVKLWDRLTVSTAEFAAKMRGAAAEAQRSAEKIGAIDSAAQGYLDRLREIASTEGAVKASRVETLSLLAALERQYGDLGAQIDATTGRVANLLDVEQRLRQLRGRRAAEGYEAQRRAALGEAKAEYIHSQGYERDSVSAADFDRMSQIMSPERMIGALIRQRDRSTDGDEIEHLTAAIASLQEAREAEQRRDTAFATGYATEEERQAALSRKQAAASKARSDLEAAQKRALEQQSDAEFAAAVKPEEKISNRRARIASEQERQAKLLDNLEMAKLDLEVGKSDNDAEMIADAERRVSEAQRAVVESMQREAALWDQVHTIEREREKKQKEFTRSLGDKAFDLYGAAMERSGSGAAFAEEKALRDARRAKGADLSEAEADQVRALAGLSRELDRLREPGLGGAVVTNSLTARGGFDSAAVVPDTERINRSIEGHNRRQTDLLQKIFDLWQSMERG